MGIESSNLQPSPFQSDTPVRSKFFFKNLTQHATLPEFFSTQLYQCLNTLFPLLSLLCARYSVKFSNWKTILQVNEYRTLGDTLWLSTILLPEPASAPPPRLAPLHPHALFTWRLFSLNLSHCKCIVRPMSRGRLEVSCGWLDRFDIRIFTFYFW